VLLTYFFQIPLLVFADSIVGGDVAYQGLSQVVYEAYLDEKVLVDILIAYSEREHRHAVHMVSHALRELNLYRRYDKLP